MRKFYFLLSNNFSMKRQSILSVLILCAFLCATLNHSAHTELIQDSAELQQCKLCQNNIDTPKDSLAVIIAALSRFDVVSELLTESDLLTSLYLVPQLRAPPF